jgi:hypothetical protein
MRCECQYSRGVRYTLCDKEATHLNAWGHMYCQEHKSPSDIPLDTKRYLDELNRRLKFRKETHETK